MSNFDRYNRLHTEIINRLEKGEITTEQAKDVVNLAFNKYIVEAENDTLSDDDKEKLKARKVELDKEYQNCEDELRKIDDINGSSEDAKKYTAIEKRMKEISTEQKAIAKKLSNNSVFDPSKD